MRKVSCQIGIQKHPPDQDAPPLGFRRDGPLWQSQSRSAAQRIGLTQPAISKTLKDLETILGVALLHRDRGGIALTREGAVFRQFAEQSLAALSHGVTSLDAISQGSAVPIRIGALPSVAGALLPDAVLRFADLSPATPVMVEDGPINAIIAKLRAGDLDLVIGRLGSPALMSGLSFTLLYAEQVVFAVAADHPQARQANLSQLSGCRVLYPPKDAAIRPLLDQFMITHGIMARSEDDPTPAIRLYRQALIEANAGAAHKLTDTFEKLEGS